MLCLVNGAAAQSAGSDPVTTAVTIPSEIPIFPLPDVVMFPGVSRPFQIYEPRYKAMVADALKGDRIIGMVLLKPGFEADYEGRPPIYEIGCASHIEDYRELPDGRYLILLRCLAKFRVTGEDQTRPYRIARVTAMPELPKDAELAPLSTLRERLASLLEAIVPLGSDPPPVNLPDGTYVNAVASFWIFPRSRARDCSNEPACCRGRRRSSTLLETK
jgi:ATP-dependent Lon protease